MLLRVFQSVGAGRATPERRARTHPSHSPRAPRLSGEGGSGLVERVARLEEPLLDHPVNHSGSFYALSKKPRWCQRPTGLRAPSLHAKGSARA